MSAAKPIEAKRIVLKTGSFDKAAFVVAPEP
jgi:hypothetical protein